jgi:DNA-binding NarL/FixJ family response regulator
MRRPAGGWDTGPVQLRCVLVDDDASFLQAAAAFLQADGMIVAGLARSCAEAVAQVAAVRPDVVLIDIRLGAESGFDTAAALAAAGPAAPAMIMISTRAAADYADLITDSPATGFLPKAQLSAAAIHHILNTT